MINVLLGFMLGITITYMIFEYYYKKFTHTFKKLIVIDEKMIEMMAEKLTTPVNGVRWVKNYYEDRAIEELIKTGVLKKKGEKNGNTTN